LCTFKQNVLIQERDIEVLEYVSKTMFNKLTLDKASLDTGNTGTYCATEKMIANKFWMLVSLGKRFSEVHLS
jgi:hypothetical protein